MRMTGSQSGRLSRHQHLSRLERLKIAYVADDPNAPGCDLLADGPAAHQHRRLPLEREDLEARGTLRGHRFGTRLHDVEASVLTVLGPFDVHRHGVARGGGIVILDLDGVGGQLKNFGILNAEPLAFQR
jgi:hypothetical protein